MLTSFLQFLPVVYMQKHSAHWCLMAYVLWLLPLKSHQRFSVVFKCGDWEGHSRTFQYLLINQALVDLEVSLRSFSCWKVQWPLRLHLLTEGVMFLFKMACYMMPVTWSRLLLPAAECITTSINHPHSQLWGWGSFGRKPSLSHTRRTMCPVISPQSFFPKCCRPIQFSPGIF